MSTDPAPTETPTAEPPAPTIHEADLASGPSGAVQRGAEIDVPADSPQGEEKATKYFTPDSIVRGQSADPKVLNEVERLWDEAGARYAAYLDAIRSDFPPGVRQMEDSYYLHDAVVRGMGQRHHSLVIVLQLDTPPNPLVTFTYDLIAEPVIDKAALPTGLFAASPIVEWQYDEIERLPGDPATWSHSILFSNGWEVRLRFRDVAVQGVQALLPVPSGPSPIPGFTGTSQAVQTSRADHRRGSPNECASTVPDGHSSHSSRL